MGLWTLKCGYGTRFYAELSCFFLLFFLWLCRDTISSSCHIWLRSEHSWIVLLVRKLLTFGDLLQIGDLLLLDWQICRNPQKRFLATWQQQCAFIQRCLWGLHGWYSLVTTYFWHAMSQMRLSNSINSPAGQGVRGTCPRRRMKLHPNNLMLLMSSDCYIFVPVVIFEVTGVHLVKTIV